MRSLFVVIILTSFHCFAFTSQDNVTTLKKEAKKRLLARKKGFDKHQKRLKDLDKKRLAKAYKMKKIRKTVADKKEKARKSFVRKKYPFPKKAYRDFLSKRENQRKFHKKARQGYTQVQDEMEEVFKNKKYRIDGKREYDLN